MTQNLFDGEVSVLEEYPFIVITPSSTHTWSDITCLSPI